MLVQDEAAVLGSHVRALRIQAGLSMRQLSDSIGWSRGSLARLELGQRSCGPRLDTIMDLAQALGVPITEIVGVLDGRRSQRRKGRR